MSQFTVLINSKRHHELSNFKDKHFKVKLKRGFFTQVTVKIPNTHVTFNLSLVRLPNHCHKDKCNLKNTNLYVWWPEN